MPTPSTGRGEGKTVVPVLVIGAVVVIPAIGARLVHRRSGQVLHASSYPPHTPTLTTRFGELVGIGTPIISQLIVAAILGCRSASGNMVAG
jgi:hypothetical protein